MFKRETLTKKTEIMKAVFTTKGENIRSYIRSTNGWEFSDTVETQEEFYDKVANWEDVDFFPQEDGTVNNGNGNEVFDPKYPAQFDFGDYDYRLIEVSELTDDQIKAVQNANPWNLDAILEEAGVELMEEVEEDE